MGYRIGTGRVQCFVASSYDLPFFMHHFGRSEYDVTKPILTDSLRAQAQPIVDKLNSGELTTDEAKTQLDKIYW